MVEFSDMLKGFDQPDSGRGSHSGPASLLAILYISTIGLEVCYFANSDIRMHSTGLIMFMDISRDRGSEGIHDSTTSPANFPHKELSL